MENKIKDKIDYSEELENARCGYQVAISSASLYGSTFWSIYNAMLVANSLVVSGVSFLLSNRSLNIYTTFISIVGLVLCIVWYLLCKRHREFSAYYILSAREIEEIYFSKNIKTLSRGGSFADGNQIQLKIGKGSKKIRLDFWSRITNSGNLAYTVILFFFILYIGLLTISI